LVIFVVDVEYSLTINNLLVQRMGRLVSYGDLDGLETNPIWVLRFVRLPEEALDMALKIS